MRCVILYSKKELKTLMQCFNKLKLKSLKDNNNNNNNANKSTMKLTIDNSVTIVLSVVKRQTMLKAINFPFFFKTFPRIAVYNTSAFKIIAMLDIIIKKVGPLFCSIVNILLWKSTGNAA